MRYILSTTSNPHINIATEEYLLRNFDDDIFMLYINEPSVIVGKHQNVFAELNYWFINDNTINVVRRLSGGGTVFHDLGNLNFCFICKGEEGHLIDFKRFTQPIVDVLIELGVPAEHSGRNDLLIHGLKFSGNAEHVYRNRTLHHGTLLYNSQLAHLKEALKVNQQLFSDKAVRSVRSNVTNIADYLSQPLSIDEFKNAIIEHIAAQYQAIPYFLTNYDQSKIEQLVVEKYSRWDWNWGYSPRFKIVNEQTIGEHTYTVQLEIEKGTIKQAAIICNYTDLTAVAQRLLELPYNHETIAKTLSGTPNSAEIVRVLFV